MKVGGPRQLDFGCGPTIMSVLSSSLQCSDITLADYSPQLRDEVDKWINREADAHDWAPIMKYIADKENMYVML